MITSEAYRGTMGHVNYGAAKGGLVGLVRSIAREMGRYGVTANAVCPTAKTRFSYNPGVLEGIKKRVEKGIMPKEQYEEVLTMPGPEYLTPMVVYLASEAGANVNGRVFSAMGGKLSLHLEPYDEKVLWKDHLKYGPWAQEELAVQIPKTFALTNPFPPEKE